jgi:hypothetical protein
VTCPGGLVGASRDFRLFPLVTLLQIYHLIAKRFLVVIFLWVKIQLRKRQAFLEVHAFISFSWGFRRTRSNTSTDR